MSRTVKQDEKVISNFSLHLDPVSAHHSGAAVNRQFGYHTIEIHCRVPTASFISLISLPFPLKFVFMGYQKSSHFHLLAAIRRAHLPSTDARASLPVVNFGEAALYIVPRAGASRQAEAARRCLLITLVLRSFLQILLKLDQII